MTWNLVPQFMGIFPWPFIVEVLPSHCFLWLLTASDPFNPVFFGSRFWGELSVPSLFKWWNLWSSVFLQILRFPMLVLASLLTKNFQTRSRLDIGSRSAYTTHIWDWTLCRYHYCAAKLKVASWLRCLQFTATWSHPAPVTTKLLCLLLGGPALLATFPLPPVTCVFWCLPSTEVWI